MCNPMAIMFVGAAASAIGGGRKAAAETQAYNEQADFNDYQARVDQDNALAEAQQIRRQGESDRGATVAAAAASGVKVGQGSAGDAERQVIQNSETDASLAILNGDRQARGLQAQATQYRRAGREAKIGAYIGAFNSLLSSGSKGMSAGG